MATYQLLSSRKKILYESDNIDALLTKFLKYLNRVKLYIKCIETQDSVEIEMWKIMSHYELFFTIKYEYYPLRIVFSENEKTGKIESRLSFHGSKFDSIRCKLKIIDKGTVLSTVLKEFLTNKKQFMIMAKQLYFDCLFYNLLEYIRYLVEHDEGFKPLIKSR